MKINGKIHYDQTSEDSILKYQFQHFGVNRNWQGNTKIYMEKQNNIGKTILKRRINLEEYLLSFQDYKATMIKKVKHTDH